MQNMIADIAVRRFANRVLLIDGIPDHAMQKIGNIRDELLDEIAAPKITAEMLKMDISGRGRQ